MKKIALSISTFTVLMLLTPQISFTVVNGSGSALLESTSSVKQNGHCTVADLESLKLQGGIVYGARGFCDIPRDTMDYWIDIQDQNKKKIPTTINQFLITPEDFYTDIAHVNHRGRYQALLAMDPNSEEGREHQSSIAHYQMMTKDLTSEYRIYITPNPEDNALVTSTLFNALRNHYAKTQKPFYSDINIFDDYSQQGAPERTITITTASKKDAQQTLDVVYNALMSYPGRFHYGVPFRMSATSLISWGQGSELYKQDRLKALYDAERVYYRPGVVGLPGADYHLTNPAD